jgi:hypothetical protein
LHDGNERGAHALILRSCWKGTMLLMVLYRSLRNFHPILHNIAVLISFDTSMHILPRFTLSRNQTLLVADQIQCCNAMETYTH